MGTSAGMHIIPCIATTIHHTSHKALHFSSISSCIGSSIYWKQPRWRKIFILLSSNDLEKCADFSSWKHQNTPQPCFGSEILGVFKCQNTFSMQCIINFTSLDIEETSCFGRHNTTKLIMTNESHKVPQFHRCSIFPGHWLILHIFGLDDKWFPLWVYNGYR